MTIMDEAGDDFADFFDDVDDFLDAGFFRFFSAGVDVGAGIWSVSSNGSGTMPGTTSGSDSTHTCAGDGGVYSGVDGRSQLHGEEITSSSRVCDGAG